jgi:hypothetical protein
MFAPSSPKEFRCPKKNGFMAALCDGSVRFFKKTMKEGTLRLYIQRNDGLPIPDDDD